MILAGDFGGTIIKLGLIDQGTVRAQGRFESPARSRSQVWLPDLKQHADDLCGSAGVRLADLEGMVWALPSVIAPSLRRASWTFGKFDDAKEDAFHAKVESLFGVPLLLENDARRHGRQPRRPFDHPPRHAVDGIGRPGVHRRIGGHLGAS